MDTAAHMRFLATVRRQSAPPRCHPFVIVLQVSNHVNTFSPICTVFFAGYKIVQN